MNAETIAQALDLKRSGREWRGPCPVCGGSQKSTKFTVTDGDRTTLVHCFGGCTFSDIVRELRSRGLWVDSTPEEKRHQALKAKRRDQEEASVMLFVYRENIARGYVMTAEETAKYLDLKRRAGRD